MGTTLGIDAALNAIFTFFSHSDSYVHKIHEHKPNWFAYCIINWKNETVALREYRASNDNENVVKRFLAEMIAASEELKEEVNRYNQEAEIAPIIISPEDDSILRNPERRIIHLCCFCKKPLGNGTVHRHHSHLPPYNYIGLSHPSCNRHARIKPVFSLYFHNSRKYDSGLQWI